jgi:hypothetical protein
MSDEWGFSLGMTLEELDAVRYPEVVAGLLTEARALGMQSNNGTTYVGTREHTWARKSWVFDYDGWPPDSPARFALFEPIPRTRSHWDLDVAYDGLRQRITEAVKRFEVVG